MCKYMMLANDDDDDDDVNWPRYPCTHVRDLHGQGHSPRELTAYITYLFCGKVRRRYRITVRCIWAT